MHSIKAHSYLVGKVESNQNTHANNLQFLLLCLFNMYDVCKQRDKRAKGSVLFSRTATLGQLVRVKESGVCLFLTYCPSAAARLKEQTPLTLQIDRGLSFLSQSVIGHLHIRMNV